MMRRLQARLDSLAGVVSPALLTSFALLGVFPLIARKIVALMRGRRPSRAPL